MEIIYFVVGAAFLFLLITYPYRLLRRLGFNREGAIGCVVLFYIITLILGAFRVIDI